MTWIERPKAIVIRSNKSSGMQGAKRYTLFLIPLGGKAGFSLPCQVRHSFMASAPPASGRHGGAGFNRGGAGRQIPDINAHAAEDL
jgi:hypothetical protein